jgi:hypothetical protein
MAPMSTTDPARFYGRHFLYRTYFSYTANTHRILEAEFVVDPPGLFRRTSACRWRTLNLSPPLAAAGRARISRGLCTITLAAQSGLADIPFMIVFEDDGSAELADVKMGVLAGRTSTTLSVYCAEVLIARRPIEAADVFALLGSESTRAIRLQDAKARLAAKFDAG